MKNTAVKYNHVESGVFFLKPVNILNFSFFRKIEPECCDLILDFLVSQRASISSLRRKLINLIPTFDTFAYKIENCEFYSKRNGKIEALDMFHEGIHSLIGMQFGFPKRGLPLTTIFNECAGLGLDIYFASKIYATGNRSLLVRNAIKNYGDSAEILKSPLIKQFNKAVKNPFNIYRDTVLDAINIYETLFSELHRTTQKKEIRTTRILKVTKKSKNLNFFHKYDASVPVLHTAASYGFDSKPKDIKNRKKFISILKQSKNMTEFFLKLGIKNHIAKYVRSPSFE